MANNEWSELYITDKNGNKHFVTTASPFGVSSEIKNLKQHLKQAIKHPKMYSFLDIDTAVIVMNGIPLKEWSKDDDELLSALFN